MTYKLSKDEKRAILICLDKEDAEVLSLLYHSHIVFGLYAIWLDNPEGRGKDDPEIALLLKKYPFAFGFGFIRNAERLTTRTSFVPSYSKEDKSEQKVKETLFEDL